MTCFWDGILHNLKEDDFISTFNCKKQNNINFVKLLKRKLEETSKDEFIIQNQDIRWNGEKLTKQQIIENYEHIKDYNPNSIYGGYLCSVCDPFLIYVCILFKLNLTHNYCGHLMKYNLNGATKTLKFKSNTGHFWAV